jgi:hypothetical protein
MIKMAIFEVNIHTWALADRGLAVLVDGTTEAQALLALFLAFLVSPPLDVGSVLVAAEDGDNGVGVFPALSIANASAAD